MRRRKKNARLSAPVDNADAIISRRYSPAERAAFDAVMPVHGARHFTRHAPTPIFF